VFVERKVIVKERIAREQEKKGVEETVTKTRKGCSWIKE